MKNKLIVLGAVALLSVATTVSCSKQESKNNSNHTSDTSVQASQDTSEHASSQSNEQSSVASTTSSIIPTIPADLIYIDQIEPKQYGTSFDISKSVHIGGNYYGVVTIVCTSLTPDIVTISNDNRAVIVVTGVGEARVNVNVGGVDKVVTFQTIPTIKNIVINNPSEDFMLNQLISLDDYVNVNVANPIGAKGDYIATASKDSKNIVDVQGHMARFIATGEFTIVIQDIGKTKTAYFSGFVTSKLQKDIKDYTKTVTNNYTNVLAGQIITVHTDNYVFYPMKRLLGANWEYSGLTGMEFEGYIEFADKTVYNVVCGKTEQGYPDVDNLKFISKLNGGKEAYWNFEPISWSFLKEFKTHVDDEGNEDYLYANSTNAMLDELIGTTYGIVLGANTVDEIRLYFDETQENNKFTIGFYLKGELSFTERFWDVNSSAYEPIETFVSHLSNKPDAINSDPVVAKLHEIINAKNFTITERTFIADPNGNEMSYQDAINAYLPLHTMYYTGTSKYTEQAMLVRNVQAFEVEGNTDRQKSHGYINKNGKVYEVNFEKDSRGNEVYNGAMSLDASPIVNSNGQQISFYGDNTSYKSLFRMNFDDWSELDFLSKNGNSYEFTIGQKSKKGSELLRNILNTALPEYTEQIFPTNLYNNPFEAASVGEGTFKLGDDGSFYFSYQVANIIPEINFSLRLGFEMTISNIGTTTIAEYDSLL